MSGVINGKSFPIDKWNSRWEAFKKAKPNPTKKECFDFAEQLLKEYGLEGLPIVPYPK